MRVITQPEQCHIGLNLCIAFQANRVLNSQPGFTCEERAKEFGKVVYTLGVTNTNRSHIDNLTFDKLDTDILGQDTDFGHLVVLINTKTAPRRLICAFLPRLDLFCPYCHSYIPNGSMASLSASLIASTPAAWSP